MEPVNRDLLERDLRVALEENQFRLYYQPQIEPSAGRIVGAEALLRWQSPMRGLLAPEHFLPALEATGLIITVGEWVFKRAAEDCQRWQRLGLPRLKVGLNVAPVQVQPGPAEALAGIVDAARAYCDMQVEISGLHLLSAADTLMRGLHTLRYAGADIAVQDFGVDEHVHRRLWVLPVDVIKIHRSFISRISDDVDADDEISGMLVLARAFRLGSVAEGVETRQQQDRLAQLRCERLQGFLHSPPVPADRFEWLLRSELYARGGAAPRDRLAFDA